MCPGMPVRPRKSRLRGWTVIAYIHSYTPNINHRQRSLFQKILKKQKQWRIRDRCRAVLWGDGRRQDGLRTQRSAATWRCEAIWSLSYESTLFYLVERKSAVVRLWALEGSVACNFNAKHGSTATCLRQQGLSQVALTGTVCEPACGSS